MSALSTAQFMLVDGIFEYATDGYIGDLPKAPDTPDSWISPINYYAGRIYIRVEVLDKANHTRPTGMLCRVGSGPHADRHQNVSFGYRSVIFTRPGMYHFEANVADAHPLVEPCGFRWNAPVTLLQIVTADLRGQMISKWEHDLGQFDGTMTEYFPLKARYTAIVVAQNGAFVPPAWWCKEQAPVLLGHHDVERGGQLTH